MPVYSRRWVSQDTREPRGLHRGRMQVCPTSPFFHANFNLSAHNAIMEAALKRRKDRKLRYDMDVASLRQTEQRRTFPLPPPALRPAFNGIEFSSNLAPVLLEPTIFSPVFWKGKEGWLSDWPTHSEMKYEGDERIITDRLHSRFPPLPRVVGNGTVNWQHRTWIRSYPLDDFLPKYREEDVEMKGVVIADSEFDDEEGREAIGAELVGMLEYTDIW